MSRYLAGVLMCCAAVLGSAASAHAWTAGVDRSEPYIRIQGDPGESSRLTVTGFPPAADAQELSQRPTAAAYAVINDPVNQLRGVGQDCFQLGPHSALCLGWRVAQDGFRRSAIGNIHAFLGDGDDSITIAPGFPIYLIADTGAGNDTITNWTRYGADLHAGAGDDRVNLRGNDPGPFAPGWSFIGGGFGERIDGPGIDLAEGDDLLNVANGWTNDRDYACGDGSDTVYHDAGEAPSAGAGCEAHQVKVAPPPVRVP